MKITIHNVEVEFIDHTLAVPLHLSSGIVREVSEARVCVGVDVDGQRAEGRGSILLSDLWAWKDDGKSHDEKDAALREYTNTLASNLADTCGSGEHPLSLGLRLHETGVEESAEPPVLARSMCSSPFDAALHDAVGQALGVHALHLYDEDVPIPESDSLFEGGSTTRAIRSIVHDPIPELMAWWIVGMTDDLEETVRPVIEEHGFQCFKLKLMGNNADDVAQTARVYRAVKGFGVEVPILTLDTNEANPDAANVLEFLESLENADPEAYAAVFYLEQPTARDIEAHAFDWREVAARKPVLLDEGLTSIETLRLAEEQGWSGLALKTCKGHSFALVAAAWANERNMQVALQDLTNTGYAAIHAGLFASSIPMINGLEINSPQFMPHANAEWLPRMEGLFEVREGMHKVPTKDVVGLGSKL